MQQMPHRSLKILEPIVVKLHFQKRTETVVEIEAEEGDTSREKAGDQREL